MATPILHMTSLANIPAIVKSGGLACVNSLERSGTQYASIAYESVQSRRSTKQVPCGPRGVLHDYVPFYLAPRSPMLFTISKGNVVGCTNGQDDLVYMVSTAETVLELNLQFVFTNGHGIMALSRFFDDLKDLDQIDWKVMRDRYWRDTAEDGDRCRRRQAEFLVHDYFPLEAIHGFAVMKKTDVTRLEPLLEPIGKQCRIEVKRDWYYA